MRSNQNTLVNIDNEARDIFIKFNELLDYQVVSPFGMSMIREATVFGISSRPLAQHGFSPNMLNISEEDKVKFHIMVTTGFLIYSMFLLTKGENQKNKKWYHFNYKPSQPLYPFHSVLMDRIANPSAAVKLKLQLSKYIYRGDNFTTHESENTILTIGALVLAGDLPFNFKMGDDLISKCLRKDSDGTIVRLSNIAPTIEALLAELNVKSELELSALPPAPGFFGRLLANLAYAGNQLCNGVSAIFRKIGAYFFGAIAAGEATLPGSTGRAGDALGGLTSTQVVNDAWVAIEPGNARQPQQNNDARLEVDEAYSRGNNVRFRG